MADSRRAEHAAVAFDFGSWAERLRVVIGKLDRLPAINLVHLADQTDRIKSTSPPRIATPEVIREQCAPAAADPCPPPRSPLSAIQEIGRAVRVRHSCGACQGPTEISMQTEDVIDVQRVGSDDQLFEWISAARLQPLDVLVARDVRILAVHALSGPVGRPLRRVFQKLRGSKRVRQHDKKLALVGALPHFKYAILGSSEYPIVWRQRGQDHGDLMRIGSNRFQIMLVSQEGIRGSGKSGPEIRRHGLNYIFLPEKTVTAAGPEVRHMQIGNANQLFDLAPQLGFRPGIQDVQAELAQPFEIGPGLQLIDDRKGIE